MGSEIMLTAISMFVFTLVGLAAGFILIRISS
uniref:Cytochrome b6f complex subunit 7 n=1 Tax=Corynoplastis japonica TaxID=700918 RepID=A0A1X9PVT7_9RHOD|nr:cytochrome b6f complex subunit 7 [Corynoplastis japonica]